MSTAKNANVSTPRSITAAGRPRSTRRVPGGVRRRKAGTPSAMPTTTSGRPGQSDASVRPATVIPADTARTSAAGRRRRVFAAMSCSRPASAPTAGPMARSAGSVIAAATAISGRSPRKTSRQWSASATAPAAAGPIRPGTTHAVDSVANILGRRRFGERPPDRDVRDGRDGARPDALEDPCQDEDPHRRRESAGQQADREERQTQPERQHQAAAIDEQSRQHDPDEAARAGSRRTPSRTGRGCRRRDRQRRSA